MYKSTWTVLTVGLALAFSMSAQRADAVHEGGVGACKYCHTMHNSEDGISNDHVPPGGGEDLLLYESSTDLCLSCHATENGAVLGPDPTNPPPELGGGNFTFLYENNINDGPNGAQNPIDGHHAGHNVVSAYWGIPEDPENAVSPGGNYPSSELSCTSCHDPHGNQNFRFLWGNGITSAGGGYIFRYPAPLAEGISLFLGQESPSNHTAYQAGWSEWCANCHDLYHDEGLPGFEHPAGHSMGGDEASSYNRYNGPGDPAGGAYATAYIPEVPVEEPSMTVSSTIGAGSSSQVTCMSCHRAHATSAPKSTRWDPNVEFLDLDGLESGSWPLPNPYTDPDQRALCIKCHYNDAEDHGWGEACMSCHRTGDDD